MFAECSTRMLHDEEVSITTACGSTDVLTFAPAITFPHELKKSKSALQVVRDSTERSQGKMSRVTLHRFDIQIER